MKAYRKEVRDLLEHERAMHEIYKCCTGREVISIVTHQLMKKYKEMSYEITVVIESEGDNGLDGLGWNK